MSELPNGPLNVRPRSIGRLSEPADGSSDGAITLRLGCLEQLFNSFDPSPFHERDLDDDAEDYIVGWARELPPDVPIRLVVHLPADEAEQAQRIGLAASFANHFSERAAATTRNRRELFRLGWRYLAIGLPVLIICLVVSRLIELGFGTSPLARAAAESLLILGWVANWKPLEVFLYDWWPMTRSLAIHRRLAAAEVSIVIDDTSPLHD